MVIVVLKVIMVVVNSSAGNGIYSYTTTSKHWVLIPSHPKICMCYTVITNVCIFLVIMWRNRWFAHHSVFLNAHMVMDWRYKNRFTWNKKEDLLFSFILIFFDHNTLKFAQWVTEGIKKTAFYVMVTLFFLTALPSWNGLPFRWFLLTE